MDQYKLLEKLGITPEKCAHVILKGVAKDKPIIPVTTLAHVVWRLARLAPIGMLRGFAGILTSGAIKSAMPDKEF